MTPTEQRMWLEEQIAHCRKQLEYSGLTPVTESHYLGKIAGIQLALSTMSQPRNIQMEVVKTTIGPGMYGMQILGTVTIPDNLTDEQKQKIAEAHGGTSLRWPMKVTFFDE